jgi:fibronectin type 3 domain-containing protein
MERPSAARTNSRIKACLLLSLLAAVLASLAIWFFLGVSKVNVTLAWDPSPNPQVSGYKIYYSRTNWEHATVIDVGNRTEYTVTGLEAGVTYRFTATAYSRTGEESALSREVVYTPAGSPSDASVSAAPCARR